VTEHTAHAAVPTEVPGRYLAQLCKHFAHRVPAEYDPPTFEATRGRIEFPDAGVCTLRAAPGSLEMTLTGRDADALVRLQDVVARHLARFAWREPPVVAWVPGAPPTAGAP
jgi:hypothetical protein